jgi:hypothetical protein
MGASTSAVVRTWDRYSAERGQAHYLAPFLPLLDAGAVALMGSNSARIDPLLPLGVVDSMYAPHMAITQATSSNA